MLVVVLVVVLVIVLVVVLVIANGSVSTGASSSASGSASDTAGRSASSSASSSAEHLLLQLLDTAALVAFRPADVVEGEPDCHLAHAKILVTPDFLPQVTPDILPQEFREYPRHGRGCALKPQGLR